MQSQFSNARQDQVHAIRPSQGFGKLSTKFDALAMRPIVAVTCKYRAKALISKILKYNNQSVGYDYLNLSQPIIQLKFLS